MPGKRSLSGEEAWAAARSTEPGLDDFLKRSKQLRQPRPAAGQVTLGSQIAGLKAQLAGSASGGELAHQIAAIKSQMGAAEEAKAGEAAAGESEPGDTEAEEAAEAPAPGGKKRAK